MAPAVKNLSTFDANSFMFSGLRKNAKGGKMIYINAPGNEKVFFELPVLRAPFGLSSYTDQNSGNVSYSLDVSLDDQTLVDYIKNLESIVLDHVCNNSEELLGRKYSEEVIRQALFKSCIRESKDGKYAPTMKLKVMSRDGVYDTKAYDWSRRESSIDVLQKGQRVKTIVDINQVWIVDNKFGLSIRLKQILMMPTTELNGCAFGDDFVDQVVNDDEFGSGEQEGPEI